MQEKIAILTRGRSEVDKKRQAAFLSEFAGRQIILLNQQHTANCIVLRDSNLHSLKQLNEPTDAILTDRTDVMLSIYSADCLPILLYHHSGIIGAVHAGRKGTEAGILRETLLLLKANFGVEKDVTLWFGPAICNDCYQVDRELDLRYDLRAENIKQAESIFLEQTIKILDSEHCTFHDNTDWYSYRKEGKGVSMNTSYIAL